MASYGTIPRILSITDTILATILRFGDKKMDKSNISRATLGRLPDYLQFIRDNITGETVSATAIAHGLSLGEVQVRKDLNMICGAGRPKIGYRTSVLTQALETALGTEHPASAVIVGAGKLGRALLAFDGFTAYGVSIIAAFDTRAKEIDGSCGEKRIYPMEELKGYCQAHDVSIGIITVPAVAAQSVCDMLADCGITSIWNFAPCKVSAADNMTVKNENLALSLAHLYMTEKKA